MDNKSFGAGLSPVFDPFAGSVADTPFTALGNASEEEDGVPSPPIVQRAARHQVEMEVKCTMNAGYRAECDRWQRLPARQSREIRRVVEIQPKNRRLSRFV